MKFDDMPSFASKLSEAARSFGKLIHEEDPEIYFRMLNDLPLDIVFEAIDRAIMFRPIEDDFLRTAMITVPEIRTAAEEILNERQGQEPKHCKCCSGRGWLLREDSDGRLLSRPCVCLYNSAKKAAESKKRISPNDMLFYKTIIKVYERAKAQRPGGDVG